MGTHSVTKVIEFCYGHRLLGHKGKCKYLHGHNGRLEIELVSDELDGSGMVIDFGDIKRTAKGWVDDNLDHKMLLCRDDSVVKVLEEVGEPIYLMEQNPTAENIAKLVYTKLRGLGLQVSRVVLWETPTARAGYTADD